MKTEQEKQIKKLEKDIEELERELKPGDKILTTTTSLVKMKLDILKKGYANAQYEILKLIDEWASDYKFDLDYEAIINVLKKRISQSQTKAKVVEK